MDEKPAKRPTIREAVLANWKAGQPRSSQELAQELGVRRKAVHEAVTRLRQKGLIGPSVRQYTRATTPRQPWPTPAVSDPATALLEGLGLEHEIVLSTAERRKVLSRLARTAPSPVRVNAVRELETLDRARGVQVGPPEPQTDTELVERVMITLTSVGPTIGQQAIELALARWKADEERPPGWQGTKVALVEPSPQKSNGDATSPGAAVEPNGETVELAAQAPDPAAAPDSTPN